MYEFQVNINLFTPNRFDCESSSLGSSKIILIFLVV